MKQEDKDFISSILKKEDEYFVALCIKYLEGVEKVTGETNLEELIKISNTMDYFLKVKDIEYFEFFKDKDPKYLEIALFSKLNKVLINREIQNKYIADGFSIEELREKARKYHAKKRANEEKLKQK